jgi:N-acetylglutamate synthase-like GNAT family acetyltransferase
MKYLTGERLNFDWKVVTITIVTTLLLMIDYYHKLTGHKYWDRVLLYLVIPLIFIVLIFRENPREYGFSLGNWKLGLAYTVIGIVFMAPIIYFLGSGDASMKTYYERFLPVSRRLRRSRRSSVVLPLGGWHGRPGPSFGHSSSTGSLPPLSSWWLEAPLAEYTLRPALESEAAQINHLVHTVGINPTGLDWRRFIVAVDPAGQIIGCGQIKPHGKDILELASIGVLPDHRGDGVARAIIERLLSTESFRPLYLMCMSHNGPMYEKFGFQSISSRDMPRYFQRIHKLFELAHVVKKIDEELLVMKLG